ncbi:MAG: tetratricopeptide repeat protein [Oligoflexia bacterium]|nr:tetratricopeptide repeat protein [Oligoflexia bacterium]
MTLIFSLLLLSAGIQAKTVFTYDDYIEQAAQMININNAKRAVDPLKMAIRMEPENWKAYSSLGLAYMSLKNYTSAKDNFIKAISLKPNSTELLYYTGVAYARGGDYNTAASYFNRALAITPNHYGSLSNLASVQRYKRNDIAAEELYKKILAEHPGDFDANYQLGLIYSKNSDKTDAIKFLEEAMSIGTDEVAIKNKLEKKLAELRAKQKNRQTGSN